MPNDSERQRLIAVAGPRDRSFVAYREFVRDLCRALNPQATDDLTEAEWRADWQAFWQQAGPPT
jgi:hypothetical protein